MRCSEMIIRSTLRSAWARANLSWPWQRRTLILIMQELRNIPVFCCALEKMEQEEHPPANLYFIRMDAEQIGKVFAQDEVARIYLNFSDPWPKDRHAKRRLTSREFLERYEQILTPDGQVEFKTDNRPLFDFSVQSVKEAGWKLQAVTYDLHRDPELMKGNVMTEYEERFSAMGNPIHKLIAAR